MAFGGRPHDRCLAAQMVRYTPAEPAKFEVEWLPGETVTQSAIAHGVGHPWLLLDHITTPQHLRQGVCEDSDVVLRGTRSRDGQRGPCSLPSVLACRVVV